MANVPRFRPCSLLFAVFLLGAVVRLPAQDQSLPVPPEAVRAEGVPQGKIAGPFEFHSQVFSGTVRKYWVKVPAQYNPGQPPCLMIVQDGPGLANGWNLPAVLDNMIHQGMIHLGMIHLGRVPVQL